MKMGCFSIFFIFPVLLSACVISRGGGFAPHNNIDFVSVKKLSELDGVYRGISDESVGHSGGKIWEGIGKIIWPHDRTLHTNIARVEIRAQGEDKLLVKAFDYKGLERKQQVFVKCHDFDFTGGRIKFRRGNLVLQDHEDPLIGPDVTTVEMGIDKNRNGKVIITFSGTGVFMIVPAAINQTTELRFQRIVE